MVASPRNGCHPPRVGVLALQGDVREHLVALESAGAVACEIRTVDELAAVDGLILPGGESTTVGKLLARFEILEPLRERIRAGMPVYGTCTGMILLARDVQDGLPGQPLLGLMDIAVRRNAFGRQRESFEARLRLDLPDTGGREGKTIDGFHAVFIRAPQVVSTAPSVRVLARHEDRIVAVLQDNMLATAFHPELTGDTRLHAWFVEMCGRAQSCVGGAASPGAASRA